MVDLSVKINDVEFKNPILTASGTFGFGEEFSDIYDINILGGIITKTVTLKERIGNPPPRVVETPSGMLNSIGLANPGIDRFLKEKLPFLRQLKTRVIINIAGESINDYVELIKILDNESWFAGYEINLSCPNVERGIIFSSDPALTYEITSKLREHTDKLLIIKLSPNVTDIGAIAKNAEKGGADAVSLINTLIGMAVDIESRKPVLGNITGGLSGPAVKPVALAKIFEVNKNVKIPIIGIGGISNFKDVLEFMITGSSLVQIGTANFFDPCCPVKILEEIKEFCSRMGINLLNSKIGSLKIN
jgi:dihydroorotate dehydrogenase (NAD+) catalytic subunit